MPFGTPAGFQHDVSLGAIFRSVCTYYNPYVCVGVECDCVGVESGMWRLKAFVVAPKSPTDGKKADKSTSHLKQIATTEPYSSFGLKRYRDFRGISVLLVAVFSSVQSSHAFSLPPNTNPQSNTLMPPFNKPATAEEVVQNQLYHYRQKDLESAYQYCSPDNQEATGDISEHESMVNTPPYDLILGHERADVLLEILPDDAPRDGTHESACYLVCIRPNRSARKSYPVWFWWELSRHQQTSGKDGDKEGLFACGEWRVDSVAPDFEDLDFEAESLAMFVDEGEEDDDDDDGMTFYMDFGL